MIETVISPIVPYDLIGKGQGFELLATFDKVKNTHFNQMPFLVDSFNNYFNKCVIGDISIGAIPIKAIKRSSDVWNDIKSTTNLKKLHATLLTLKLFLTNSR